MQLEVTGLGHWFDIAAPLFSDLNFRIQAGELVALMGPSGSGKSTLLSVLSGWLHPEEGYVSRSGIAETQWVFQSPHGPAGRTALDVAAFPALARGAARTAANATAQDALELVGLTHRAQAPFRTLSGGEAQRLMLARAVTAKPDLLLVDEPTAQLDPHSADSVVAALARLAAESRIVIIATHDTRVQERCQRTIDLADAR